MAAQFTATTASVEALFLLLDCSYSLSRGLVFITLLLVEDYFSTVLLQLQPEWKPMFYYFTAATASEEPYFSNFTAATALVKAHFVIILLLYCKYSLRRGLFFTSMPGAKVC